jgi:hypothetical protein
MERADQNYSKFSGQMEYKVDKFLELHDTLTKGNHKFVTTHPYNQLVSCKLSIKDFHKETNEAFDYTFVQKNCDFVLDHLKNNLDPLKSVKFLESIVELGNIKRKDFLEFFPSLKAYYKKEDIDKKREEAEGEK